MNRAQVVVAALVIAAAAELGGVSTNAVVPMSVRVAPTAAPDAGTPQRHSPPPPTPAALAEERLRPARLPGSVAALPRAAAASISAPTPGPATPGPTTEPTAVPEPSSVGPTLGQLIGQRLVVAMEGRTPTGDLLGRIRRGEVGGVILFGSNVATEAQLVELTATLQRSAADGGQPPLLISVDQEGGSIQRIPWAPPDLSAAEMGRTGDAETARAQGGSTGAALAALGVNLDLAPVADVPESRKSFMYQQGRTISFDAQTTAVVADAFAAGLESAGVIPAMKHFPGIGLATQNTDARVVTIAGSADALASGLLPYRRAIANHIPLIMLSNATYTAYDDANAAGWSVAIGTTLLRGELGFAGVTITDSLDGTANSRRVAVTTLAIASLRAGTDLLLTTGSESSSRAVYDALLIDAQAGSVSTASLRASYARILALKVGH